MSMDVGGSKGSLKADINVTPLVDVMLVLLIIMMLIAPMLQKGVNVTLPIAGNTAGEAGQPDADGGRGRFREPAVDQRPAGVEGGLRRSHQDASRRQDRPHRPHQG